MSEQTEEHQAACIDALEQERDEVIEQRDDWRYRAHLYGEHRDDYKAKLAAAEQREAEKDKLLRAAKPIHYVGECDHCGIDALPSETCPHLAFIARIEAALASPSTPSPAKAFKQEPTV